MENQHRKISGYRELSQEEIDLMNEAKELGEKLGSFVEKLSDAVVPPGQAPKVDGEQPGYSVDGRWLAIAKTDLQKGIMALIRSLAQPTTF